MIPNALVRCSFGTTVSYAELLETTSAGYRVQRLDGSIRTGFTPASDAAPQLVAKLECPIESTPIIQCVGVNYRHHAEEAKLKVPAFPVIFTKPADALNGPTDDVSIHPDAQGMMDFEGELAVIMGRDAKNVKEDDALDYVLGYAASNDVSSRLYQMPDNSGGQFAYAKSFDGFAPIGHAVWSTAAVPDPQALNLVTRVNGEERQRTSTSDMIWTVKQIIAHLSRGTTLRAGTVIMTGTPSGVGFFAKRFLKHGDIVEVEVEPLGKIVNKMVFE